MLTILIVDDDPMTRRAVKRCLQKAGGWSVLEAGSEKEAEAILDDKRAPIDIVLTDYNLGEGGSGLHVIGMCRDRAIPVAMMSGTFDIHGKPNDVMCFPKPFDFASLSAGLHRVVGR